MNWKPIKTAPKDGTEILAYTTFGIEICRFVQDEWTNGKWINNNQGFCQPTHWMVLPPKPVTNNKQ